MPGAVGAYPDVRVRVEAEACKLFVPSKVLAILQFAVFEMENCPGKMTKALRYELI